MVTIVRTPEADADDTPAAPGRPLADGLGDLAGQFDRMESALPAGEGADPAAPPQLANGPLLAQIIGAARDTACMLAGLEVPRRTLTDDKVAKLGDIWGGVLDHYGIQLSDVAGKYSVILAAVGASIPLLAETVIETRKEIAAKDATRPAVGIAAPGAAPPIAPIAPGAAVPEGVVQPSWTAPRG